MVLLFCYEMGTAEIRPLGLVNAIFPLTKFMKLMHLVLAEAWRQPLDRNVSPRSTVSRSPEPISFMQIVVATLDEIDVIWDTHRHIHLRLRQHDHCWRRIHNHRRRFADVDVYAHLAM